MDSLSQIALGAAVADLTLGRRIGRRALVLGAVLGTLPDLDVLVRYSDAIDSFTLHRSFSHSLFVLSLVSLPIAVLARRVTGSATTGSASLGRWWFACWAVLITHPLLDAMTVYGTQLFWPLPVPPVAIGSIFIIDPLYTLPLLLGIVIAWRGRGVMAQRAQALGLAVSTAWLVTTLVLQQIALSEARIALADAGFDHERIRAVPFPLGVLWRVLALEGDDVHETWVSLVDGVQGGEVVTEPRGLEALGPARELASVQRLDWFTQGFVGARVMDDTLVLTDLRIGTSRHPIFAFSVADVRTASPTVYHPQLAVDRDPVIEHALFGRLARRAVDARVEPDTATLAGTVPLPGRITNSSIRQMNH